MNGCSERVLPPRPSTISSAASLDDSDRYLFSRSGEPAALSVWIVPRSWLVAVCSGATLFVGFFVIFTKIRFRTIWLGIAGWACSRRSFCSRAVTFLVIQSAFFGVVLTLLGILIERLIERSQTPVDAGSASECDDAARRPPIRR